MILLSPKKLKSKITKQVTEDAVFGAKVQNELTKEIKKLNTIRSSKVEEMESISQNFIVFAKDITSKKAGLENEVATLEKTRIQLMKPIDEILKKAKVTSLEVEERLEIVTDRATELDTQESNLSSKANKLDRRDITLKEKEDILKLNTETIKEESKTLKKGQKDHQVKIDSLESREKELSEKITADKLLSTAKESSMNNEHKALDAKMKEISKENRKLIDRRATLERGFAELKRKQ